MSAPVTDLEHVLRRTEPLWEEVRGQRIFITGGTGFFGSWLLESFVWANRQLGLDARAVVLTRSPEVFAEKAAHLAADPAIELQRGDVQTFDFPAGEFSHIVHAATETAARTPADLFASNVAATRRVLEFAERCGARKLLFTSSGAVYGAQPPTITHVGEKYAGAPLTSDPATAYGQSKRISEFLCAAAGERHDLHVTIARCFAFVGPWLPLRADFAIGNFIADALRGGSIQVKGDGTPWRSYLYAADLAIWLWTILFAGQSGRGYNVGSDADLTIAELASLVAEVVNPGAAVATALAPDPARPPQRYVPSIDRARTELGLEPWVDLREAIRRTAEWHRASLVS